MILNLSENMLTVIFYFIKVGLKSDCYASQNYFFYPDFEYLHIMLSSDYKERFRYIKYELKTYFIASKRFKNISLTRELNLGPMYFIFL